MKIKRLVANGCSFINHYTQGHGHHDLANSLNIPECFDLSVAGSSNQRIIRTTLQDCYQTKTPTLYIIGITFLYRFELPVLVKEEEEEEKEDIIDNSKYQSFNFTHDCNYYNNLDAGITINDINTFKKLLFKFISFAEEEQVIALYNSIVATIDSIIANGHTAVVFNTGELIFKRYANHTKLKHIKKYKQIIESFNWLSNRYQFDNGAKCDTNDENLNIHQECKHVASGQNKHLNKYLINYINTNNII